MEFRSTLFAMGNNTGVEVPESIVEALGAGRKPPVTLTLNGSYTYRSTVAVMGGRYLVAFSAAHRAASGIRAGDDIVVEIALDTEKREIAVPDDLAAALEAQPPAREYFEKLSYSNQRRHVDAITSAKAPETRARRIEKSVALFADGRN